MDVDYMASRLEISGPPDVVAEAVAMLRSSGGPGREIGFASLAPPDAEDGPDEGPERARDDLDGMYDDIRRTGSTETAAAVVREDAPGRFVATFDTGSGVPHKAVAEIARRFPTLEISLDSCHPSYPPERCRSWRFSGGGGGETRAEAGDDFFRLVHPDATEDDMAPVGPTP